MIGKIITRASKENYILDDGELYFTAILVEFHDLTIRLSCHGDGSIFVEKDAVYPNDTQYTYETLDQLDGKVLLDVKIYENGLQLCFEGIALNLKNDCDELLYSTSNV